MKLKSIVLEVLICLLILLFIYASLSKLLDFYEYRKQLYNQAFPAVFKPMLLWIIPVSELLLTALRSLNWAQHRFFNIVFTPAFQPPMKANAPPVSMYVPMNYLVQRSAHLIRATVLVNNHLISNMVRCR